jgi:S-adenosylhomocysteine hydrolase
MFPSLPVLEELSRHCPDRIESILAQTVFICVQHILSTTGSLFQSLIELGARPSNIFVLGKCYSTNSDVLDKMERLGIHVSGGKNPLRYGAFSLTIEEEIRELWSVVHERKQDSPSKKIIVIDDGGKCLTSLPGWVKKERCKVVGIEQTTSGIKPNELFEYPLIEVASSAAKRVIESPMIAEAVSKRICHSVASSENTIYGIVGYGNIGKALFKALSLQSDRVLVYDRSPHSTSNLPKEQIRLDIQSLIKEAQFILGCTGEDIIPYPEDTFKNIPGQKILASCSSGDIEFNKLLSYEHKFLSRDDKTTNPLNNIEIQYPPANNSLEITILRGGFPVNFDGSPESVPSVDIQLTRGLLLGAVIQGALYFNDLESHMRPRQINHKMLNPFIQSMVVEVWKNKSSYKSELVEDFKNIQWIESKSDGSRSDNDKILDDSYSPQCTMSS